VRIQSAATDTTDTVSRTDARIAGNTRLLACGRRLALRGLGDCGSVRFGERRLAGSPAVGVPAGARLGPLAEGGGAAAPRGGGWAGE